MLRRFNVTVLVCESILFSCGADAHKRVMRHSAFTLSVKCEYQCAIARVRHEGNAMAHPAQVDLETVLGPGSRRVERDLQIQC